MDLLRPPTMEKVLELEEQRFKQETSHIRKAFRASMLAAHTIEEVQEQVVGLGLSLATDPEHAHFIAWRQGRFA